jgi:hypothetical protein
VTAAWSGAPVQACPLRGRCSECGLAFLWGEVLNPAPDPRRAHVEATKRLRAIPLARTAFLALVPVLLWRRIRLEDPVRPARLALAAALALALPWCTLAIVDLVHDAWALYNQGPPNPWMRVRVFLTWGQSFWPLDGADYQGTLDSYERSWLRLHEHAVASGALFGGMLLLLRPTLRLGRIRRGHLVRVGVYLLPTLGVAFLFDKALEMFRSIAMSFYGLISWGQFQWLGRHHFGLTLGADAVWIGLFWWAAIKFYLRLPHALAIVVLLGGATVLLDAAVLVWGLGILG